MKKNLKLLLTVLCLFSTSLVTIATSKKQDGDQSAQITPESLLRKDYYVASNCPGAIRQERITVTNERIEYPSNLAFINFGLPADTLNLTHSSQVSRDMGGGRIRTCDRYDQVLQAKVLTVFTCTENGVYLCQISFEPYL